MAQSTKKRRVLWTAIGSVALILPLAIGLAVAAYSGVLPGTHSAAGSGSDHGDHGHAHDDHVHDHGHDDHGHDDHAHDDHGHDHADDSHDHGGHSHGQADHDDHANDHAGHDDANSIELSDVARKNIGLKTGLVQPRSYTKTVSVPAIVVERPGRSQVSVTAPLTGIVTRVYPIEGQSLQPGEPLFALRLTHEDLVTAQREFLTAAQELDVVNREINRLESIGEGVIAGRRIVEQKYERDKIEATMHAQRQGLLLHGLDESQIDDILTTRQLLQMLTVNTPPFPENGDHQDLEHLFHVQQIDVKSGQHVTAGDSLSVLADHCLLYVEGQAFENDVERLHQVIRQQRPLDVIVTADGNRAAKPLRLKTLYIADNVDPVSRALHFYLSLPNQLIPGADESDHRFVAWKYRPGQRMDVRIPLGDPWENQIVLPKDAVVEEGAESFVFERNDDHFDRIAVHVLYRAKDVIVVKNDDSLVGSTLAMSGAYQMHLAMKNKAGGGVDPHAGHTH